MGGPDAWKFSDEIHKLIRGLNTVRKNDGDIKLCNADKRISSLLMISQLNTVFDHYTSLDQALEAYNK